MKKFRQIFLFFIFFLPYFFYSQKVAYKSQPISIANPVVVNLSAIENDWMPDLQNIEAPSPDSERGALLLLKEEMRKKYPIKKKQNISNTSFKQAPLGTAPNPIIYKALEGNTFNSSVPLDNDIAISNNGMLVSVVNSNISVYDVINDTMLLNKSLAAFATPLGLTQSKYDPKVIYDPNEDRFIVVFLNGFVYQNSAIIVAFSQTNDPSGNWNLYTLPGNPLNNNLWSDYPMIALTEKDFFLTINLLQNNTSWQLGFQETLIWQIKKSDGYAGIPLTNQVHSGIEFNGKKIRNLCPVKTGNGISGPNMYFLSNKNLSVSNDSLFLVEVTNSLESQAFSINAKLFFSPFSYFLPPSGRQANNVLLQTNDSRVLGAFLHNNQIQFVQNTMDTSTGFAAIYHGIVKNVNTSSPSADAYLISDTLLDFGYPNISYSGTNINYGGIGDGENESIIMFNHTAPSVFAGVSAVYYSNAKGYSGVTTIKSGTDYIDRLLGNAERWGDYSGSQRVYNEPGKVWIGGTFGKPTKTYSTWLAKLGSPDTIRVSSEIEKPLVYPNPMQDVFSITFSLIEKKQIKARIYDIQGKLVTELLDEYGKPGQNIFSFSTAPLVKGLYFLIVESDDKIIAKEKIVKSN